MSFVDVFGLPEEEPEERQTWVSPPWFGPPDSEVGVVVALNLVLARSDAAVVVLPFATAYSTGIGFELHAQARGLEPRDTQRLFHEQHLPPGTEPSDALLRVGVQLPSGERVSNLGGRRPWHDVETPPPGSVLMQHGGGGGTSGNDAVLMRPGFWLWPLPDTGTLRLSCEWPIVGIPLTTVELDTAPLLEASQNANYLWP